MLTNRNNLDYGEYKAGIISGQVEKGLVLDWLVACAWPLRKMEDYSDMNLNMRTGTSACWCLRQLLNLNRFPMQLDKRLLAVQDCFQHDLAFPEGFHMAQGALGVFEQQVAAIV